MNISQPRLGLTLALAFFTFASAPALAQLAYDFSIIAQEGDIIDGLPVQFLSGAARINENGDIAFSGGSGSTSAVWSPTALLLAEGQNIGGGVILPDFTQTNFDYNDAGEVAVSSGSFSIEGVYTSTGTAITTGSTIDGATISGNFDVNVALANDGTLVFIADVETAPGVFTTTVFDTTSILAQEGQTIGGITLTEIGSSFTNGLLDIDDAGNAVFYNNSDFFSSAGEVGIVSTAGFGLEDQSPFPTGTLAGQPINFISTSSFALGVNGPGDIIIQANVGGVSGLYSQQGLVVADGVIDGVDGFFYAGADLNDSGSYVSFFSDFDTIGDGIVVDGSIVITDLDTIGGFDIDSLLTAAAIDLNNNGDFVFVASLDDGIGGSFYAVILATPVAIQGDLNGDGFVDGLDLGILLANWNQSTTPDMGELDGTPPVDGLDLGILLSAWNPPPATAAVPEPSALLLTFSALCFGLVRTRR